MSDLELRMAAVAYAKGELVVTDDECSPVRDGEPLPPAPSMNTFLGMIRDLLGDDATPAGLVAHAHLAPEAALRSLGITDLEGPAPPVFVFLEALWDVLREALANREDRVRDILRLGGPKWHPAWVVELCEDGVEKRDLVVANTDEDGRKWYLPVQKN